MEIELYIIASFLIAGRGKKQLYEKELPYIVNAELISSDEAKKVRHEAFIELKALLKKIGADLRKLPVAGKEYGQMNLSALKSIQNKLEILSESAENADENNFNTRRWMTQIKRIINLFSQINNEELESSLVEPETKALLAQFRLVTITDANSIIDDPNAALIDYKNFTFSGEYERLGKELQEIFPRFLGYRVEMQSRFDGFSIDLKESSPTISTISEAPAKAIKPIIAEFLSWHLRKIGYTMMFELTELDQNTILCEITIIDSEDPLQTIIEYKQAQVESSETDVTRMNEFLMNQLKTEVVNDWKKRSYARAEFYPPVGKIITRCIGKWLWIRVQVMYGGARWDPSTDRLRGDFERTERWYEWVGPAKAAPKKVVHPEELDKWAETKTSYIIHNLLHEGSEIVEITEEGEVKIRVDT
ncbi:MAG: hypothetical protein ACFFEF_14840, partial [Candidatus Thorarchaeota archaeon]